MAVNGAFGPAVCASAQPAINRPAASAVVPTNNVLT
jgi:hypothetical protein